MNAEAVLQALTVPYHSYICNPSISPLLTARGSASSTDCVLYQKSYE